MAEYIERERAIQKVKNVIATEWFRGNYAAIEPLQRVVDVQLGRMTAADVAPVVHARWTQVDETKCRCSNCDIIALIGLYPHGDKNFCPNCGAKMDEEETHDR